MTALLPCPACRHSISSAAVACPSCGHGIKPVQTEGTAKTIKLLQLVAAAGLVAGWGWAFVAMMQTGTVQGRPGDIFQITGLVYVIAWLSLTFASWWRHG